MFEELAFLWISNFVGFLSNGFQICFRQNKLVFQNRQFVCYITTNDWYFIMKDATLYRRNGLLISRVKCLSKFQTLISLILTGCRNGEKIQKKAFLEGSLSIGQTFDIRNRKYVEIKPYQWSIQINVRFALPLKALVYISFWRRVISWRSNGNSDCPW